MRKFLSGDGMYLGEVKVFVTATELIFISKKRRGRAIHLDTKASAQEYVDVLKELTNGED